MYIEQLKKFKINSALYLVTILGVLFFFGSNIVISFINDVDTNVMLKQSIELMGKNLTFLSIIIPFAFLLIGLLLWVKFVLKQSITSLTTGRKKIDWKRILFMFLIWGGFLTLTTLFTFIIFPEDLIFQFNLSKFIPFFIIAILFVPLQTSFEEYFFRGIFVQYIGLKTNSRFVPLILSSLIFGLLHFSNPEVGAMGSIIMIFYIGTGLILGIMTLMDDGLELSLGFHAANNLVGAILVTSTTSVFQTDSVFLDVSKSISIYPMLIQVFVIYPLLLLLCSKKYKWNNWKQNLFGKLKE